MEERAIKKSRNQGNREEEKRSKGKAVSQSERDDRYKVMFIEGRDDEGRGEAVFYHPLPITATHGGNQSARFPFASRYYDTSCPRLCVRWIDRDAAARKSPLNLH